MNILVQTLVPAIPARCSGENTQVPLVRLTLAPSSLFAQDSSGRLASGVMAEGIVYLGANWLLNRLCLDAMENTPEDRSSDRIHGAICMERSAQVAVAPDRYRSFFELGSLTAAVIRYSTGRTQ